MKTFQTSQSFMIEHEAMKKHLHQAVEALDILRYNIVQDSPTVKPKKLF